MSLEALQNLPSDHVLWVNNDQLLTTAYPDSLDALSYHRLTTVAKYVLSRPIGEWNLSGGEVKTLANRIDQFDKTLWTIERWIYKLAMWILLGTDLGSLRQELRSYGQASPDFAETAFFEMEAEKGESKSQFECAFMCCISPGNKDDHTKALKLSYQAGMTLIDELKRDYANGAERLEALTSSLESRTRLMLFPMCYRTVRSGYINTSHAIPDKAGMIQQLLKFYQVEGTSDEKQWRLAYNHFCATLFETVGRDALVSKDARYDAWFVADDVGAAFHIPIEGGDIMAHRHLVQKPGPMPLDLEE